MNDFIDNMLKFAIVSVLFVYCCLCIIYYPLISQDKVDKKAILESKRI